MQSQRLSISKRNVSEEKKKKGKGLNSPPKQKREIK